MEIPLTNTDFAMKAVSLGEVKGKIDELEKEFGKIKDLHKADLSNLEASLNDLLEICRTKKEKKMVEVTERRNYAQALVQYVYDGQVLDERTMEGRELQRDMFEDVPALESDSEEKAEALPIDEQIAKDIQESTHQATASSAVQ